MSFNFPLQLTHKATSPADSLSRGILLIPDHAWFDVNVFEDGTSNRPTKSTTVR